MHYYHVWVRSDHFRGHDPLTYCLSEELAPGSIVQVPLRSERVLGFVSGEVAKPAFAVKPITSRAGLPALPHQCVALAEWLQKFYAAPVGVVAAQFLPNKLQAEASPDQQAQQPATALTDISLPAWTEQQKHALNTITQPDTYLLHGRTGSGKTNIYLELARRSIAAGKSALILSPEIGLTSQLAREFQRPFGNRVIILHSQLSASQRASAWKHILTASSPLVVIGLRSALFRPLSNLGLIVVDEAHDGAYKQEQAPYYQTLRVAAQLRSLHGATLILGSATPPIGEYYLAETRKKSIIRLTELARHKTVASHEVMLVDLKGRSQFSRSAHLSQALIDSMSVSLQRGEQSLLYLNRRGTARITLCDVCGWQATCPHCDLPLAYHGDTYRLRCHTCGYSQSPATSCPVCGNTSVVLKSFGTKAIVDEAQKLFPDARIMRFDTDNAKDERLEHQYAQILDGQADILVGTQLLAKGLDLPKLSTLGVVLADTSLYLPDYTARERTYQLLTQVLGRVGRGHVASRAIVQTFYPNGPLLAAAINDDWEQFYQTELAERKQYGFPPFTHLLKLSCRRATAASAERAAKLLKLDLERQNMPIVIDGPAPAFHEKVNGKYQWQLVIKARRRSYLLAIIGNLPGNWTYDLDPSDLL